MIQCSVDWYSLPRYSTHWIIALCGYWLRTVPGLALNLVTCPSWHLRNNFLIVSYFQIYWQNIVINAVVNMDTLLNFLYFKNSIVVFFPLKMINSVKWYLKQLYFHQNPATNKEKTSPTNRYKDSKLDSPWFQAPTTQCNIPHTLECSSMGQIPGKGL